MNDLTIDRQTLQSMLVGGEPVTLLDIRNKVDFQEWSLPNSLNADVIKSLRENNTQAMTTLKLPLSKPVVTICGAGVLSQAAAEQLRAQGYKAWSLAGGMKAWSMAWNVAELSTTSNEFRVIQVRRTGKGCLSYLIGSGDETAVVDASLNPEIYIELAQQYGWEITHVLDTHVHADHLSRSRLLAQMTGATLYLPYQAKVKFPYTAVYDNDVIGVGWTQIKALHTPGHTLESSSYLVADGVLLTGDTLFLSTVGRPDLEATGDEATHRAHLLYQSLQRLMTLSPVICVLPGHADEPIPFDNQVITASLGQVRQETAVLSLDEDAFVATVLQRIPATPPNHARIVAQNVAGHLPEGDLTEWEAGANRCAI